MPGLRCAPLGLVPSACDDDPPRRRMRGRLTGFFSPGFVGAAETAFAFGSAAWVGAASSGAARVTMANAAPLIRTLAKPLLGGPDDSFELQFSDP
jgi:hypothetical protein